MVLVNPLVLSECSRLVSLGWNVHSLPASITLYSLHDIYLVTQTLDYVLQRRFEYVGKQIEDTTDELLPASMHHSEVGSISLRTRNSTREPCFEASECLDNKIVSDLEPREPMQHMSRT